MALSPMPETLADEAHESKSNAGLAPRCDDLDQSLGYTLRRAQLSIYSEFNVAMASFEIRPSQYAVLGLIQANPGLTQSAICGVLGIQKANFVALLDRLVERGLAERRKVSGDRRSSALYLTMEGKAFVRKMLAAHRKLERSLAGRLGETNSRLLLSLLREFCDNAP
jgi:DNA-binding MarR family transcriptional regulator